MQLTQYLNNILRSRLTFLAFFILFFLAFSNHAYASTITVNSLLDDGDGTCTEVKCTLRDAIATSNPGDTITFSVTGTMYYLDDVDNSIEIDHDLTINGPGADQLILDFGGHDFYITHTAGELNVSGLTFTNDWDCPIYEHGTGTLNISNVKYIDNVGGFSPLYIEGTNGVTLDNVQFINNTEDEESGGAITAYNGGDLTITNSTFTGNTTTNDGGAIYFGGSGNLNITGSTFTGNSASSGYGGSVYFNSSGNLEISNSTFTGNSSNSGGAVYYNITGDLTITNSTFTGNTASSVGGAVYTSGSSGEVTITGSTFTGNSTSTGSGGAIYFTSSGNLEITNSTFTGNSSAGTGGALHVIGDGTSTISNSAFTDNTAYGDGGALYFDDQASLDIVDSTFNSNTNNSGSWGGAIYFDSSEDFSVSRSTFYNNSSGGFGGAINIDSGNNATISNSTFVNNTSPNDGVVDAWPNLTTIINSTFYNNDLNQDYIIRIDGNSSITNSIFYLGNSNNCYSSLTSLGHNIDSGTSCGFNATGDLSSTDPLLDTLKDNGGPVKTIALLAGSPAINAGDDNYAPLTDARGVSRSGISDIGAYEYVPPVVTRTTGGGHGIIHCTDTLTTFCNKKTPPTLAINTTPTPIYTLTKTLKPGNKGNDVKNLQTFLNTTLGFKLKIDGVYGKQTIQAIKKFQKDHGLKPDGVLGPKTLKVINELGR